MAKIEMQWVDLADLPARPSRRRLDPVVAQLRETPGEWAMVRETTPNRVYVYMRRYRSYYPDCQFKARKSYKTFQAWIYARCTPEEV